MLKPRWLTTSGLMVILVTLALMPTSTSIAKPRLVAASDKEWVCTIAGGIVGAGVGAATAGITGGLALVGFTAGCQFALSSNHKPPTILIGSPMPSTYGKDCFYYWWRGRHHHKWRGMHCRLYYA